MEKYKMIEYKYDEDTKRTKIVLEEGRFFKKETTYVDTGYTFKQGGLQVFCTFPEMTQINNLTNLTEFLNDCLRRINFEKTGKIKL